MYWSPLVYIFTNSTHRGTKLDIYSERLFQGNTHYKEVSGLVLRTSLSTSLVPLSSHRGHPRPTSRVVSVTQKDKRRDPSHSSNLYKGSTHGAPTPLENWWRKKPQPEIILYEGKGLHHTRPVLLPSSWTPNKTKSEQIDYYVVLTGFINTDPIYKYFRKLKNFFKVNKIFSWK